MHKISYDFASHRIASHRIASHRIGHNFPFLSALKLYTIFVMDDRLI